MKLAPAIVKWYNYLSLPDYLILTWNVLT